MIFFAQQWFLKHNFSSQLLPDSAGDAPSYQVSGLGVSGQMSQDKPYDPPGQPHFVFHKRTVTFFIFMIYVEVKRSGTERILQLHHFSAPHRPNTSLKYLLEGGFQLFLRLPPKRLT